MDGVLQIIWFVLYIGNRRWLQQFNNIGIRKQYLHTNCVLTEPKLTKHWTQQAKCMSISQARSGISNTIRCGPFHAWWFKVRGRCSCVDILEHHCLSFLFISYPLLVGRSSNTSWVAFVCKIRHIRYIR
jgi:hypothetical protein